VRRPRARARPRAELLSAEEKAVLATSALVDHRAVSPVLLDMRSVTLITDFFLICHGTSNVHIRALADAVTEAFAERGLRAFGVEGYQEARWVLLDYGDVVIHVLSRDDREFYDLERLWSDAARVPIAGQDEER
jgi:ribosome-associated protein